jgi:hypothetical protein
MKSLERRSAPRVPVSVYVHQHVEGQSHRCLASNLSLSGLYMERPIASFVRHSAEIELEIPLPDSSEPVRASAEIVYDCFNAMFHGTAVRFKRMSAHDRARLGAFLTPTHSQDAHKPRARELGEPQREPSVAPEQRRVS